jgi:hypothetical protein
MAIGPLTVELRMFRRRTLGVVGAALVLAAGGAALVLGTTRWRGDREILEGYTAMFDVPPTVAVAPCPDADAKLERLRPLFAVVLPAYKVVRTFDAPLPPELAKDLMAKPIAGLVDDYRCFLADGSDRLMLLGTIVNLYLRKGEALLAEGQTDAGYAHVIEGLSVYKQAPFYAYIHYLGAGYVLELIRNIVEKYPPPRRVLEELEYAAPESLLSRVTFCTGMREELLTFGYISFYDRLAPLRARATRRWGERSAKAFALMDGNGPRDDLAAWRMTRALSEPLIDGCYDFAQPLMPLEKAARAKLEAVPKGSSLAFSTPFTLDRLPQFGALEDDFLVFMIDIGRRRLRLAGLPTDAASVRSRLLGPRLRIPLTSDWNGATAVVEDDPAAPGGIVIVRGAFRQALPALSP